MLMLCQGIAEAGTLRDFEGDASKGSDSSDDDDDDQSCFICDLIGVMLKDNDNDEYNHSYRSHNPPVAPNPPINFSDINLDGRVGINHGFWGKDFSGTQVEATFAFNHFLVDMNVTHDVEAIGRNDEDAMNTTRMRLGFSVSDKELTAFVLGGFSALSGASTTGFVSTRLGAEYIGTRFGTRWTWDGDFGEAAGFHDFQGLGLVKAGPVEFSAGYRFRISNGDAPVLIHGPQMGVSVRF